MLYIHVLLPAQGRQDAVQVKHTTTLGSSTEGLNECISLDCISLKKRLVLLRLLHPSVKQTECSTCCFPNSPISAVSEVVRFALAWYGAERKQQVEQSASNKNSAPLSLSPSFMLSLSPHLSLSPQGFKLHKPDLFCMPCYVC